MYGRVARAKSAASACEKQKSDPSDVERHPLVYGVSAGVIWATGRSSLFVAAGVYRSMVLPGQGERVAGSSFRRVGRIFWWQCRASERGLDTDELVMRHSSLGNLTFGHTRFIHLLTGFEKIDASG